MGKKWVQMNLPFFALEAYVPGGVQNQTQKNSKECLLAGTGTKIDFSRKSPKVLKESAKGVFGPPECESQKSTSPKRSRARCDTAFGAVLPWCETGFARCERLFWDSRPRKTKTILALSLSPFGHPGCFETCARPEGSQLLPLLKNVFEF